MTRNFLRLWPLAALVFVLTGCPEGGQPGDACETDDECADGNTCRDGVCGQCATSDDCVDDEICLADWPGGVCASPCDYNGGTGENGTYGEPGCLETDYVCAQYGEAGQICLKSCGAVSDCGAAYACTTDGYCRPNCQSDDQCGRGRSCSPEGTCVAGSAQPGEVGATCSGDTECTAGTGPSCATQADGWPGGTCVSSCADVDGGADACPEGGACIVFDAATDASFCMQGCGSNFDCRPDYYCQHVGSGVAFCMPRCNADGISDFCAPAGLECEPNSGACVEPGGGGGGGTSDIIELGNTNVAANQEFGDFDFEVDADVSSFAITVTSTGGGTSIPYRIVAPGGREVFNVEELMNSEMRILPYNDGSFGVLYPNSPRLTLNQGTWRFSLYNEGGSGTATVRVILKRAGQNIRSGTIDVNAFIATEAFGADAASNAKFQRMMGSFQEIWAAAGLNVGTVNVINVTGADRERYSSIDSIEGQDSTYRTMIKSLTANVSNEGLNFFFVDHIGTGQAGFIILGIAAGIPGIPVLQGNNTSGVAVSTELIDDAGLGGPEGVGSTMAHEGGHWLGLYHTTEQPGTLHDPLPDTKECSASNDRDGSGYVDAGECSGGKGSQYLMFWEAALEARDITPNQAYVLLRNPAVK